MKAVVWHGIGDIRLDDVPTPTIKDPTDAVVRITTAAICGTDLHFVRGTMTGMEEGTILGHEAVGVVEVFGVDAHPSRLDAARHLGAEVIDYGAEDPVAVLRELTGGSGPDRVIDAVGVEAERPRSGPAAEQAQQQAGQLDAAQGQVPSC